MFWTLWKSTRPNLKQLYLAFHSEKFTFLLQLSKFSPGKSYLRGSNILCVNEKSMTNNCHQFWTFRKSTRSNLILLYIIAFYSEKFTFLLHLSRVSPSSLKSTNYSRGKSEIQLPIVLKSPEDHQAQFESIMCSVS